MKELKPIEEESWNKKRVLLGFVVLAVLIAGALTFKSLVLDKNQGPKTAVEGASVSVENTPSPIPIKANIQDQIDTLQKEASNINITDIATSSPQVQKVLNDLKSIQGLPQNQAKSFCQQVCNNL